MVVEGPDDFQFFNGKIDRSVLIQESFSGKPGVYELVSIFSDNRVIGICDADYEERRDDICVFYYDFCCMEMMMISNDTVFSSFCNTFYFGDESPYGKRESILRSLLRISLLRKNNVNYGWGLKFDGLNILENFNTDSMSLSEEKILSELKKINPNKNGETINNYWNSIDPLINRRYELEELYNLTQGHDFMSCFQKMAASRRASKKVAGKEDIFNSLISAYRYDDFKGTLLYRQLNSYQRENSLLLLS